MRSDITLEQLNAMNKNTIMEHLDIVFTEIGEDYISAKMPVDHRHHQPFGLLHGGASVVLAETLGSTAAHCSVDTNKKFCVGLEINANHLRGVKDGYVHGTAKALHTGQSTQVWEIKISNDNNEEVCVSRITMAVLDKR